MAINTSKFEFLHEELCKKHESLETPATELARLYHLVGALNESYSLGEGEDSPRFLEAERIVFGDGPREYPPDDHVPCAADRWLLQS